MDAMMAAGDQPEDDSPQDQTAAEAQKIEAIEGALQRVIGRLDREFQDQVARKRQIEVRWLEDYRAYYGKYPVTVQAKLTAEQRSEVFVMATRDKTNAWEARLYDMLFPTDDENWDIEPTPEPELDERIKKARGSLETQLRDINQLRPVDEARAKALAMQVNTGADAQTVRDGEAIREEARDRCRRMRTRISDQLAEERYNIKCRDLIHDLCRLGTGVLCGPFTAGRAQKRWQKHAETNAYAMAMITDPRPEIRNVNLWHYFPQMSATCAEDKEFDFERFMENATGLKRLAEKPGYNRNALRELILEGAREPQPDFINELRTITGIDQSSEYRYQVIRYVGPLEDSELTDIMNAMLISPDEGYAKRAGDIADLVNADPLFDQQFVVTFCQGKLLKFDLHPLDSGESLYSVMPFERDEASVFGLGVPRLMKGSQKALNGAWRMMLDNAALSAGPQIVIDKNVIKPENGSWAITPRKVWLMSTTQVAGAPKVFELHNIQNNQGELLVIVNTALKFVDDESSMPTIAQGEQASHETKTAGGMSLLMNSANVVFRRVVRNFDDCITVPTIRRMYDWNMQHAEDDAIKGDMEVVAKGSSVLLVREIQAPNLMAIVERWSTHPLIGPWLKVADAARKTVTSMMIPQNEIIKTNEEKEQDDAKLAQQKPQPTPEDIKGQWALKVIEAKGKSDMAVEDKRQETIMMKTAAELNMTMAQVRGKLMGDQKKIDSDERMMAVEVAAADRMSSKEAQTIANPAAS
jgi:hypothetical protein